MLLQKYQKQGRCLFSESNRPPPNISPHMAILHPATQLPPVTQNSRGLDELNLAEFPLTHLGSRSASAQSTLEFHDQVFDEGTQQQVDRSLLITGSPLLGLPGPVDADVLLTLMHLTQLRNGFGHRRIEFTRYELVQFLGWDRGGASWRRLEESLQRWTTVTLQYKQAWWDRSVQRWKNQSFHILESLGLQGRNDSCEDRLSWLIWNETIFSSCQSGNLKKLDLQQYFQLQRPAARQLYRFLDKRFYHRSTLEFSLRSLACEHVGFSRRHATCDLKRKLQPAIEELEQAGFLKPLPQSQRYRKLAPGNWNIVLTRQTPAARKPAKKPLIDALLQRGLSDSAARQLTDAFSASHINEKIDWHDRLRASGDRRLNRNPAGFLKQAIEQDYQIPDRDRTAQRPSGGPASVPAAVTKVSIAGRPANPNTATIPSDNPARNVDHSASQRQTRQQAARLTAAQRYWNSLSATQQAALEADLLQQSGRLHVEVYRRHQHADSVLRDELRWNLVADYLQHRSTDQRSAVPKQPARSTTLHAASTQPAGPHTHSQSTATAPATTDDDAAPNAIPD